MAGMNGMTGLIASGQGRGEGGGDKKEGKSKENVSTIDD